MPRKTLKPVKAKLADDHPFFGIIEDAYRVFAYRKPTELEVCKGCCMEPEIEADFFTPDIRELPLHYVQDWFFAAYDPPGVSKAIWGYLLPRVLEVLAADEEAASVGKEVVLKRFPTGVADHWSAAEWDVLDRFQRAYLARELQRGRGERVQGYLDDTLCMFGIAGWPLDDLLAQVAAAPNEVLARRFWQDWCAHCVPGRESIWIDAFWEGGGNSQVFAFYTSRALCDRIEALALADGTPEDLVRQASAVADVIRANADWA